MSNRWRKFRLLSWQERKLLLKAIFALTCTKIMIRLIGLRRCQTLYARLSPVGESESSIEVSQAGNIYVSATSKLIKSVSSARPLRASCLEQSLTLWWLLRLRGIKSDMRIGIRIEDELRAHAWVECQGVVINDTDDVKARFVAFDEPIIPPGVK